MSAHTFACQILTLAVSGPLTALHRGSSAPRLTVTSYPTDDGRYAIPVIAGVSGASTLAADLGDELGMTVIGFLRGSSFNIYSGAERIN